MRGAVWTKDFYYYSFYSFYSSDTNALKFAAAGKWKY